MRWMQHLAAVCAAAAGIGGAGLAISQEQAGEHRAQAGEHPQGAMHEACPEEARPILSVGDFNGDTIVDGADLAELAERIVRRDKVAFFDMNADRRVDTDDLLLVARQVGARSTPLDQELAAVFRATERYRDIRNAIADGFVPATESFIGHGVHWVRNEDADSRFDLTRPEGLNYSEDGELLATFYAVLPGEPAPAEPPPGLTGDEAWHYHTNACFHGFDPEDPSYDWRTLHFEECVPEKECTAEVWLEKFYMLHLWLFDLNRCGVFGGVNPGIETGVDPSTAATRCPGNDTPHEHVAPMGGSPHGSSRPAPPEGTPTGEPHNHSGEAR